MTGNVSEASFLSILILDGEGVIVNQGEKVEYKKGDSFFMPAGCGSYTVKGTCDALITTVSDALYDNNCDIWSGVCTSSGCQAGTGYDCRI